MKGQEYKLSHLLGVLSDDTDRGKSPKPPIVFTGDQEKSGEGNSENGGHDVTIFAPGFL